MTPSKKVYAQDNQNQPSFNPSPKQTHMLSICCDAYIFVLKSCCCLLTILKTSHFLILHINSFQGMTATGDHGGDSENELNAAMFVYSQRWSGLDLPLQPVNISNV